MGGSLAGHYRRLHAYAAASTALTGDSHFDWGAIHIKLTSTGVGEASRTLLAVKSMVIYQIKELTEADYKKPANALRCLIPAVQALWPSPADDHLAGLLQGRRPSTVAPALWAVWAKELAGHFAGHPTPYHTPEDTLARAWLLYWTRQQQQEKAGGTVAVAVEGGHEEQATPLLKQEEGGMEGILDEAGWAELEKMELAALVTPGSPRHRPGFANRDDPDPLPHVVAPAFHAPGSLLPLGADIAPLVFDEAAMGMEIDDPRVPALQSELAACKAQLAAAEQRLAQLEMAHAQLLAWLAAWASATSGQEGGVVGSA